MIPTRGPNENGAAERLRLALEMFDLGLDIMRQNLRRKHPEDTQAEIQEKLRAWLQDRPGAEFGDAVGNPRPFPA